MAEYPKSPAKSRLQAPASYSGIPRQDANNRRSMLLPPGSMVAATQRTTRSSIAAPKQRPITTNFSGGDLPSLADLRAQYAEESEGPCSPGSASTASQEKDEARAAAHAKLTGGGESKLQSIAKPKTGIARNQSLRKPGTGGERPQSMLPPTRSQAASATRNSRPLSTLVETKKPAASRPASSASAGSIKSPTDPVASRSKLPPPANGPVLRRAQTTTTRHVRTQSTLSAAPTAQGANTGLPRLGLGRRPTLETNNSLGAKPAFNTLQQHYSPQKTRGPKPASATLIHSQPSSAESSLPLETQFLQARLLQLSILHREAVPALHSWENSARLKLSQKFKAVARQCQHVQEKELQVRRDANVSALKEWCGGDSGSLAENVQVLSNVVTETTQLLEPGGRVEEVIGVFSDWLGLVEGIWDLREENHGSNSVGSEFDFIDGLGETWEAEAAGLGRRLGGLGRMLEGLDMPRKESSLWDLMSLVKLLIEGAVEELAVVGKVQREVVEREKRWVDEKVKGMEADIESVLVGAW
ncbi:hypothetical protein E2P81_ATG01221 [Venturia nashicola]|uniref:Uncharacterized protein n=1 Tax=Venturia nashicola TaxID=86259 RepID=A0A4Z1PTY7_9PEZI|nr:hypothetical protein E6O75_ATG01250 [Venturia nashicola]TLD38678.1 hypothetical protein E2P81_ATG01221 [Venturia nashicola]